MCGSVANVKISELRLAPIGMGPTRLWPKRLSTSTLFKWKNRGYLMSTLIV